MSRDTGESRSIKWYCGCEKCRVYVKRSSPLKAKFYRDHRGCRLGVGAGRTAIQHWLYKSSLGESWKEAYGPLEQLGLVAREEK
jgi:hypothetical protein